MLAAVSRKVMGVDWDAYVLAKMGIQRKMLATNCLI